MQKLEKAKITLNDCLACSGCITSAESILITQQSHEELYRVLRLNKVLMYNNKILRFLSITNKHGQTPDQVCSACLWETFGFQDWASLDGLFEVHMHSQSLFLNLLTISHVCTLSIHFHLQAYNTKNCHCFNSQIIGGASAGLSCK